MEIRGLSLEQIEQAVETASLHYNGNLEMSSYSDPLNKRGDAWRVRFGVKSARRPGSRVSNNPYMDKPKRIASACWHAHRDIFRAIFDINPDARIKTALAEYHGSDDFEDKFPATAYGNGHALAAPISNIGDACNCDEGDYPHYAIEGLSEIQYQDREWLWEDEIDGIKKPKFSKAVIHSYVGGPA